MSLVIYDAGYDTRLIKKRKNMVAVRLLAAIKEKTSQDIDRQKMIKILKTLPYLSSEYRNLRHTIPLPISLATTVSNLF
mgnify:CR=1 FL=1